MRRRTILIALVEVLLVGGADWLSSASSAQGDASPTVSASPSPAAGIASLLPTEAQVPTGLVVIEDGERSLDDVAAGFSDPEDATERFVAWGWQRNVIRAFHVPEGASADPNEIDGIYISVHEFGSADGAAEALDYALDAHAAATDLEEISVDRLGDSSRALYGKMPYGNEITLYVQRGNLLIRLSASSPEGDPRTDTIALMQTVLNSQPATPVAT